MTVATLPDLETLLQRIGSLDLTPTGANARARRNARRVFQRLVEQLPPGAVQAAWDTDQLTVEQHLVAVRWRLRQGLQP